MTLRVADTLEVRRWILGYGAEVEAVDPPDLRERLRSEAEELARRLVPERRPLAPAGSRKAGGRASPDARPVSR
jgi:hypothetical protein